MRKVIFSLLVMLIVTTLASASQAKSLVIVFSRADENYRVGTITKGNTMILAEMIAAKTDSELFEVKPVNPYPANYEECTDVAKREQNQKARPAIVGDYDISEYDTIFLGYPVWWGDLPMCLYTFIEAHDWSGKKVYPFCTHEGSGLGRTESNIARAAKGCDVRKGIAVRGSVAQNEQSKAEGVIDNWLKSSGF